MLARGALYRPTALDSVTEENVVACEEVYRPVLPLLSFSDWDEAIRRANAGR